MPRHRTAEPPESALYAPVKALLEGQGYEVKGEIAGCDVVGVRGDDPRDVAESYLKGVLEAGDNPCDH